jgi:hypothetical protein
MKRFRAMNSKVLVVLTALVVCFATVLPAVADEEKPTAEFSSAFLSKYVWRGFELSKDSLVIQPSATVSYKGFSANLWGNLDTDPYSAGGSNETNNWNETDMTLAYGRGFFDDFVSAELGYIYYALDAADDSQEFYLSLGLDVLLSPTLTVYREFAHYTSWYILLGISHSFELMDWMALDLSGSVSYLYSLDEDAYPEIGSYCEPDGKMQNFHDGVLSASLPMTFWEYFTVAPTISYSFPLSSDSKDLIEATSYTGQDCSGGDSSFVYGGVTCSFAF